jgi:hypothetical protein
MYTREIIQNIENIFYVCTKMSMTLFFTSIMIYEGREDGRLKTSSTVFVSTHLKQDIRSMAAGTGGWLGNAMKGNSK